MRKGGLGDVGCAAFEWRKKRGEEEGGGGGYFFPCMFIRVSGALQVTWATTAATSVDLS